MKHLTVAALMLASCVPASAATINFHNSAPERGNVAVDLGSAQRDGSRLITEFATFSGFGERGTGSSRIGNGWGPRVQTNGAGPAYEFGRYSLDTGGMWVDSEDRQGMLITFAPETKRVVLHTTDTNDKSATPLFRYVADGGAQRFVGRQDNGTGQWVEVLFAADDERWLRLDNITGRNDGFGVGSITADIAPVPLPAAAWLLLAGLGWLGGLSWRRRKVA